MSSPTGEPLTHGCGVVVPPGQHHECELGLLVNLDERGSIVMGTSADYFQSIRPSVPALVAAHDAMVRGVQMSQECAVHVHDTWVPINRHHIHPLGMGGRNVPENVRVVCMNGHGAIHAYLDYLIQYGAEVPWELRRRFGHKVQSLAMAGWLAAGQPRR